MSLKNKWRKRGRLEFRRESKRYHDGSIYGPGEDVLFIRVKGKACVFATYDRAFLSGSFELWANDGLYFKPRNAVHAAKQMRRGLMAKVAAWA